MFTFVEACPMRKNRRATSFLVLLMMMMSWNMNGVEGIIIMWRRRRRGRHNVNGVLAVRGERVKMMERARRRRLRK